MSLTQEESPRLRLDAPCRFSRMSPSERALVAMKTDEMIGVSTRRKSLGFGIVRSGHPRSNLAYFSALLTMVTVSYGLGMYFVLLQHDVKDGWRCRECSLKPAVAYWWTAAVGAVVLVASHLLSKRTFLIPEEHIVDRVAALRCGIGYELVQLVVTFVALTNWVSGVNNIALIDVPGDPWHRKYIHGGHRGQPKTSSDVRMNGDRLSDFHRVELLVMWCVALNAVTECVVRVLTEKTMYHPKLWSVLDAIELGTFASTCYPRIFDVWAGKSTGKYSTFIAFGVFRTLRFVRFERRMTCLFSKTGIFSFNGTLVRFASLVIKFAIALLTMSVLVCCIEFPCDDDENDECNAYFKSYVHCLYFIVVTFSTVGYGDMYPATREGRLLIVLIVLFILAYLPGLLNDLNELADGDDMSTSDKTLHSLRFAYEEVYKLKKKLGDLSTPPSTPRLNRKQTLIDQLQALEKRLEEIEIRFEKEDREEEKVRVPETADDEEGKRWPSLVLSKDSSSVPSNPKNKRRNPPPPPSHLLKYGSPSRRRRRQGPFYNRSLSKTLKSAMDDDEVT